MEGVEIPGEEYASGELVGGEVVFVCVREGLFLVFALFEWELCGAFLGEVVVEFVGCEAGVYVVFLFCLLGGEREAGPDDGGRVERGDEEGEVRGWDVIDEMAVWQGAAGEVEERTSLSVVQSGCS